MDRKPLLQKVSMSDFLRIGGYFGQQMWLLIPRKERVYFLVQSMLCMFNKKKELKPHYL